MSRDFRWFTIEYRRRFGERACDAMSQRDRANAIYQGLRALNAERVGSCRNHDAEQQDDILSKRR